MACPESVFGGRGAIRHFVGSDCPLGPRSRRRGGAGQGMTLVHCPGYIQITPIKGLLVHFFDFQKAARELEAARILKAACYISDHRKAARLMEAARVLETAL